MKWISNQERVTRKWAVALLLLAGGCGPVAASPAAGTDAAEEPEGQAVAKPAHPYKGIWKKESLVVLPERRPVREAGTHYKFYADSVMMSVWVRPGNSADLDVAFQGTSGSLRYLSDMAVFEGDEELHVKLEGKDAFKLNWYRNQGNSLTSYEEDWRRADSFAPTFALFLKYLLHPKEGSRFDGVWKLKGVRLLPAPYMVEATYSSYKLYGDRVCLGFDPSISSGFAQRVKGQAGAFEVLSDTQIRERGEERKVEWVDDSHFKVMWKNGNWDVEELWERRELPQEYRKVLDGIEALSLEAVRQLQ